MKRTLSKLAALFVALAALSGSMVSASNLQEVTEKVEAASQESETTENTAADEPEAAESSDNKEAPADAESTGTTEEPASETETEDGSYNKIPYFAQPTDYLYRAFNDVLNLYVKEHLYDFDRLEVLEKFAYDLIQDHPELYEMLLNTMLGTMDSYSSYHEGGSTFLSVKSPNAGFGIVVKTGGDSIIIDKVMRSSPAETAGIQPGDKLIGVMGFDITGLGWNAVSEMMKKTYAYVGAKNDKGKYDDYNPEVTLTVERDGAPLSFTLKKDVVDRDELSYSTQKYRDIDVGYITISSFLGETLAEDFKALVNDIQSQGIERLIIDLRDNGGGSLDLATSMAELFTNEGDILYYLNNRNLEQPEAVISDNPQKADFRTISVLVNENTASAAELMASILRNRADAVLVGKTTYGKALGQNVFNFVSGSYITITTYEVLDANGESYNAEGLVPDLVLDNVECLYEFPTDLPVFNHENYKLIVPGEYSEPCLALERRLALIGYLRDQKVDGIWDDSTALALRVFRNRLGVNDDPQTLLDDRTVTQITTVINGLKDDTYYEDSQFDVALIYHSSLSQAKRMLPEKDALAKKQKKLIEENNARLEALADADL